MAQIKRMKPEDRERVMRFMELVHPDAVSVVEAVIFRPPFRRPDEYAYIEDAGNIVSFAGLHHHAVRLGDTSLRAGEIAVVGTHPDYHRRGLASELMNYWLEYMREHDMPLAFLFGIPNFYQHFLFEYAVPHHAYDYVTIAPEQLEELEPVYRVRELVEEDLEEVNRIYNLCCRDNPGTKIRPLAYWSYRVKSTSFGPHSWQVVVDEDRVRGYLWLTHTGGTVTVREAGALDEAACRTMAAYLYQLMEGAGSRNTIGVKGPQNNIFAQYLYMRGARFACRNEIFPGSWAGMFRVVDLSRVLAALASTLTRRLQDTRWFAHTGRYRIDSEIGSAALIIENGRVRVGSTGEPGCEPVHIPAPVLTQLLMGYRDIDRCGGGVSFPSSEIKRLLKHLFPEGYPFIWDLEMSEELL